MLWLPEAMNAGTRKLNSEIPLTKFSMLFIWLSVVGHHVKLLIMFGILKVFIFDESLNSKFKTDEAKADFVISNLTKE